MTHIATSPTTLSTFNQRAFSITMFCGDNYLFNPTLCFQCVNQFSSFSKTKQVITGSVMWVETLKPSQNVFHINPHFRDFFQLKESNSTTLFAHGEMPIEATHGITMKYLLIHSPRSKRCNVDTRRHPRMLQLRALKLEFLLSIVC